MMLVSFFSLRLTLLKNESLNGFRFLMPSFEMIGSVGMITCSTNNFFRTSFDLITLKQAQNYKNTDWFGNDIQSFSLWSSDIKNKGTTRDWYFSSTTNIICAMLIDQIKSLASHIPGATFWKLKNKRSMNHYIPIFSKQ